jgi:tRNA(Ile)-lysidine synthase
MHRFVRNLVTEWRRLGLPVSGETAVVAVSGGADSVSLMLALIDLIKLKKLDIHIVAAHFNHDLRSDSGADEVFVQSLAVENGIEFVAGKMRSAPKGNLEEAARRERYKFLNKIAIEKKAFSVLTGHTKNDQAETFLMNLIRGSGAAGLSAMPAVGTMPGGEGEALLVRPLLSWAKRAETEGFCNDLGVRYRQDSMNDELRFTRVRIRKELLPKLAEYNPKIIETLARTAELLAGQATCNEAESPESIAVSELKVMAKPELYRTLRSWLRSRRGGLRRLELKHIESIERLIHTRKSGKTVELPAGERVIKQNGQLVFVQTGRNHLA